MVRNQAGKYLQKSIMKTVAVVAARSGSKGFPNKNIAKIGSKTLIELAVIIGKECPLVEDVYISTDSKEYETIALGAGAKSIGLRPNALGGDTIQTSEVVVDLIKRIGEKYDLVLLLQPTSPLRMPKDIENIMQLLASTNADAAISLEKIVEPHPYKMKRMTENDIVKPLIEKTSSEIPRQLLSEVYRPNGAFYLIKKDVLINRKTFLPENTVGYVMERGINIDTEYDFILMKELYRLGLVEIFGL